MTLVWHSSNKSNENFQQIMNEMNTTPSVAKLLSALNINKIEDARRFFKADLSQICDPFLLLDMKKAIDRIILAIENEERILIHGDYDADGVTTLSVFYYGFKLLGVKVDTFAPNRFKEGYGLNINKMKEFGEKYDLIISGDTGIVGFEAADYITNQTNCDLIITDHHEPRIISIGEEDKDALPFSPVIEIHGDEQIYLPNCVAVIDQHRLGDPYPNKSLAGVGVAFKVMQGLFQQKGINQFDLFQLLDYVAVGSIADLAPQMNKFEDEWNFENRVFCKFGIAIMNEKPKPWVKAIALTSGIIRSSKTEQEEYKEFVNDFKQKNPSHTDEELSEYKKILYFNRYKNYLNLSPLFPNKEIDGGSIGFKIGPTLNAPGRLYDPMVAFELLTEENEEEALKKAINLSRVNAERQEQTKEYENVIKELEEGNPEFYDYGIVVCSDKFHSGIAGLVAGKVQQHFYRPTIALSPVEIDGEVFMKGSARSIEDVHVLNCLHYVRKKMGHYHYGGHPQAAGMTVPGEKFEDFRKYFREACMEYDDFSFLPKVKYDATLEVSEIDFDFINHLKSFEPFGEGMFMGEGKSPTFRLNDVKIVSMKEQKNKRGANFKVSKGYYDFGCVTFSKAEEFLNIYHEEIEKNGVALVDILFTPSINEWMGEKKIQFLVSHMKKTES